MIPMEVMVVMEYNEGSQQRESVNRIIFTLSGDAPSSWYMRMENGGLDNFDANVGYGVSME